MKLIDTTNAAEYRKAGGSLDSSDNQRIRGMLVERGVVRCCSSLIDAICKSEAAQKDFEIDFDDLMEVCSKVDYREAVSEWVLNDTTDLYDLYIADLLEEDLEPGEALDETGVAEFKAHRRQQAMSALAETADDDVLEIYNDQSLDRDPDEALEHWIVERGFALDLQEEGEMVSDDVTPDGWWVWGRTCSGQPISMDHVIGAIAAKMMILSGQRNSWKDK